MTTLILVRHGQSEANRQGVFAGNLDADLTELGLAQAACTAEYIAKHYKVDKVYASDLKRAYKTGKAAADLMGVEIIPDRRLREISAGAWEGVTFDVLQTQYAEDYQVWLRDIGKAWPTQGESVAELGNRVFGAIRELAEKNDGKTLLLATHATPIRVTQSLIQTGGLEKMKDVPWVSNASVSVLQYDHGTWQYLAISEDAHLADLKTVFPSNV
jgi:broad specificity phosphatase PhoE